MNNRWNRVVFMKNNKFIFFLIVVGLVFLSFGVFVDNDCYII